MANYKKSTFDCNPFIDFECSVNLKKIIAPFVLELKRAVGAISLQKYPCTRKTLPALVLF